MKHEINLLPVNSPRKNKQHRSNRKGMIFFAGAILVVITIYGVLFFLDLSCQQEIKKLDEMISSKSEYQIIYTNLSDQKGVLEYRTQIQDSINMEKELPIKALTEIRNNLPADVNVSKYIFQDALLSISGETGKNDEILRFKDKLTSIDFFKVINMVRTSKSNEMTPDNKNQSGEEVWEFTFDIEMDEVV